MCESENIIKMLKIFEWKKADVTMMDKIILIRSDKDENGNKKDKSLNLNKEKIDDLVNIFGGYSFCFEKIKFSEITFPDNLFECIKVEFKNCIFTNKLVFSERKIEKITFGTCVFEEEVYFNECEFIHSSFYACRFEKNANFHRSNFKKAPNFSQSIFKEGINLLNAKFDFSFDDLKEMIKEEYREEKNKDKCEGKKSLNEFAVDFKDSFRVLKNALIKDSNLLEASKFHKYELYCEEIELQEIWNKKGREAVNRKDVAKNIDRFRHWIDSFLLGFYRNLCEHHTDFLRIFNNLIVLSAFYALSYFLFIYVEGDQVLNAGNSKLYGIILLYLQKIKEWILSFSYVIEVSIVFFILLLFFLFFLSIKTFARTIKESLNIFKEELSYLVKDIVKLLSIFLVLIMLLLGIHMYTPQKISNLNILINIAFFCSFIAVYLWLVSLKVLLLRCFIAVVSYLIVFLVIGIGKISILNPLLGKLVGEGAENPLQEDPLFIVITFAYTILMFLVLFSLQKTARKNSIVPH